MTLADLLVGAVIIPIRTTIDLYGTWVLGREFGLIFLTLENISLGVSVLGVVVITIDRFMATMFPMTHYTKKSKRVAIVINIFTCVGFCRPHWDYHWLWTSQDSIRVNFDVEPPVVFHVNC
ncbi:octopamine receptor 2-like [Diadema antillarum]|uniref:octopamine receptor 2-like n=1 Tax=Diadema antillarum TaxID=105358 RepID=UPI003A8373C2